MKNTLSVFGSTTNVKQIVWQRSMPWRCKQIDRVGITLQTSFYSLLRNVYIITISIFAKRGNSGGGIELLAPPLVKTPMTCH